MLPDDLHHPLGESRIIPLLQRSPRGPPLGDEFEDHVRLFSIRLYLLVGAGLDRVPLDTPLVWVVLVEVSVEGRALQIVLLVRNSYLTNTPGEHCT